MEDKDEKPIGRVDRQGNEGFTLYPASQGVRVPQDDEAKVYPDEEDIWVLPKPRPLSQEDFERYAKEIFSISETPSKGARYFIQGSRVWIRDLSRESEYEFMVRVASNKDHNITIEFFVPKDE